MVLRCRTITTILQRLNNMLILASFLVYIVHVIWRMDHVKIFLKKNYIWDHLDQWFLTFFCTTYHFRVEVVIIIKNRPSRCLRQGCQRVPKTGEGICQVF